MEVTSYFAGEQSGPMNAEAYFNRVYDETYPDILKLVIIKTSHADQVEDILQNTYHSFYTRIVKKGFQDIQSPRAFLIRLAERELARHYKSKALKRERETDLQAFEESIGADGIPFADLLEDQDALGLIREAVLLLPLLSYKSFVLFYYYDMPIAQIAEQLHVSEQNVKVRLWRARNALRKDLKGDNDEL